jgi:hypothetical protein
MGLFGKGNGEPVQLTAGPMDFSSPVSSVDGNRLFVIGEQRRGELVRFDSKSGRFVPYLGGIPAVDVDVSKGWRVGHLRFLSRASAVAEQGGRQPAASA